MGENVKYLIHEARDNGFLVEHEYVSREIPKKMLLRQIGRANYNVELAIDRCLKLLVIRDIEMRKTHVVLMGVD